MAGPWEQYQSAAPTENPDGPWSNYQQQPQQSPSSSGGDIVSAAEQKYRLPPGLLGAVISKESSGNPNATSSKGAMGLTQVMPDTARGMGYDPEELKRNPAMQVDAGARYLKQMIDSHGNIADALAAYNWGPGNMRKLASGKKTVIPQETINYVTDPRFAKWTQPAQPGSPDEMEQLAQQANSAWAPETPSPSFSESAEQAGKGLLQSGVNALNIPGAVVNTALDAAGIPKSAQVMQLQLPQGLQPTDTYAQLGAEIGPYLIPGIGAERTAQALSSVANAGKAERAATQVSNMLAENLPGAIAQSQQDGNMNDFAQNTGLALGGSVIGRALMAGGGRAINVARNALNREVPAAQQAVTQSAAGVNAPVGQQVAQDYARAAQSGSEGRIAQIVNDIKPDQNVVDAMRRLDLNPDDMLEAYTSGNDAFKAVQMGLASQDESMLGAVRRDSINRISQRASQIIDDAGAMPDRLSMDQAFKQKFTSTRDAIKAQEEALYKPVQDGIPARQEVDPVNTRNLLDSMADDLGGYNNLSPVEKRVYEAVSPTTDKSGAMTYARLNQMRAVVGAELRKSGTPFGSAEERNLSQLYSQLSNDRDAVAKAAGFGEQVKAANALTAQRKMMEERMRNLLGKDLSGDITAKAQQALNGLSTGNTKSFSQLMRDVPDSADRTQLIATGMRDMLRKGSRSDLANNINGFVDYYGSLKRNGNIRLLHQNLPHNTVRELDDFYTLARNVKSANQYYLATGKLKAFLDKFDQPGGFLDKLATHGKMAAVATALGHVPVAGPVLNTAIAANMGAKAASQKAGAAAVQDMMSGSVWKNLAAAARKKPSAAAQDKIVSQAEKTIAGSKAWKAFYRTLPAEEKKRILRNGIIGWLSGATDDRNYSY